MCVLYWPSVGYDFVEVDDPEFVSANGYVRQGLTAETIRWAFTTQHASNWIPLSFLSLALDSQLFGVEPAGYHRVNVLLHGLNAALLFLVLTQLTQRRWIALVAAGLWAVHPLRVESVVWIAERKDVLSTLFWILCMGSYARFVRGGGRRWYLVTAGCLSLGLLAKAMLVTLPAVLFLLDSWPLRRESDWKRRVVEKIPLMFIVVADAAATIWAQRSGGAVSSLHLLSFADRLANALVSYLRYIEKLFWPKDLAYLYPHPAFAPPDHGWPAAVVAASAGTVAAVTLLCVWLWRRHQLRYPLVGWLFYLGTLVPVLGIFQVGVQSMADRYSYVPHMGLILLLVCALSDLVRQRPLLRPAGSVLFGLTAALLIFATAQQIPVWKNGETLFRAAVERTERNSHALNGLGATLARSGRIEEAQPFLQRALDIDPRSAEAHVNFGLVLAAQSQESQAEEHYRTALRLDPKSSEAHVNLGTLLATQGRLDEAERLLQIGARLDPHRWQIHLNLGLISLARGDARRARQHFEEGLRLDPTNATLRQRREQAVAAGG